MTSSRVRISPASLSQVITYYSQFNDHTTTCFTRFHLFQCINHLSYNADNCRDCRMVMTVPIGLPNLKNSEWIKVFIRDFINCFLLFSAWITLCVFFYCYYVSTLYRLLRVTATFKTNFQNHLKKYSISIIGLFTKSCKKILLPPSRMNKSIFLFRFKILSQNSKKPSHDFFKSKIIYSAKWKILMGILRIETEEELLIIIFPKYSQKRQPYQTVIIQWFADAIEAKL